MRYCFRKIPLALTILLLVAAQGFGGCAPVPAAPPASPQPSASDARTLPRQELNLYMPGSVEPDQELVEEAVNVLLEERLNCRLDIRITEWNLWSSRYPILLSSGEPVDMMFSASYFGYLQDVARDAFLPLDDLLASHGQGIASVMLQGYLDAARVKDVLYAIPVNKDTGQGWGIVANRELADMLDVDFGGVRHLEDLEPILKKAGASLSPGTTPLFLSPDLSMFQLIGATRASETIGLQDRSRFVQFEDGLYYDMARQKALPIYEEPVFLEQCEMVRAWFKAGYINPDVTTTQRTAREAMQQGDIFMHVQAQTPVHLNQWQNETGRELVAAELVGAVKETQSMTGALAVLPVGCRDPERAMMVLNVFWTERDLKNLFTWGIEGKHYVREHDNLIRLPNGVTSADQSGYNPGNFWHFGNAYLLDVWTNEHPQKWEQLRTYCENMRESPLLGFSFDGTLVRRELAARAAQYDELGPLLVNGVMEPAEVLERLRAADKKAGLDRICAEMERQVALWLSQQDVQP